MVLTEEINIVHDAKKLRGVNTKTNNPLQNKGKTNEKQKQT